MSSLACNRLLARAAQFKGGVYSHAFVADKIFMAGRLLTRAVLLRAKDEVEEAAGAVFRDQVEIMAFDRHGFLRIEDAAVRYA